MATILRPGLPEEAGMSSRGIRHVAELAHEWVEREGVQTLVELVARRGRVVLHEACGRMGPEADAAPVTVDALFDTQSIGKVLTATAVMLLVEEGRVGLNRPVSSYLPRFRGEGKDGVLIRHLLTHTSGLRSEDVERFAKEREGTIGIPSAEAGMHPIWSEYFALREDCPLWKRPGAEMSYCSYGFELLGEIVRRVSGESLDVFSQRRIFAPLGMKDTWWCHVDVPVSRRVRKPPNPTAQLDALDRARETERIVFGSGGVYTTALDMAVFLQMILNGGAYGEARILGPATVNAMTRNQIPGVSSRFLDEFFPEASWGLGWNVYGNKAGHTGALQSADTFGHGGAGGVSCWADPRDQLVAVCFSVTPANLEGTTRKWAEYWRNDLFSDAVTASITEP